MNARVLAVLCLSLLAIAGCAAGPEIPFDHSTANDIKTIGIIPPSFPDGPKVVLASTVGQSFGLIGALVDIGMQTSRESKFKSLLNQQHFIPQDILLSDLIFGLQKQGYVAVTIPYKREKADFAQQYPDPAETKVDAYLDIVVPAYGYLAAGISDAAPYRPAFVVKAKLVRARDSSVLMQDTFIYNPLGEPKHVITIAPDPAYQFADFDTLMGQPDNAVKGLQAAFQGSTDSLLVLLK